MKNGLTLVHLLLFALELGGDIARVLFGEDAVLPAAVAQVGGLRGGMAHTRTRYIIENLVVRMTLKPDGRAGA